MRPCIERGCPETTEGTRCPRHQRAFEARRQSRTYGGRGGSSAQWQRLRLTALARDRHTCQMCGRTEQQLERYERMEVHHRDGDRDHNKLRNLVTLCSTCHRSVTTALARSSRFGPRHQA